MRPHKPSEAKPTGLECKFDFLSLKTKEKKELNVIKSAEYVFNIILGVSSLSLFLSSLQKFIYTGVKLDFTQRKEERGSCCFYLSFIFLSSKRERIRMGREEGE